MESMRRMRIGLQDENGKRVTWHCWRDMRYPASWIMEDHSGTKRTLEYKWDMSVPRLRLIAENHGLKFLQEIN